METKEHFYFDDGSSTELLKTHCYLRGFAPPKSHILYLGKDLRHHIDPEASQEDSNKRADTKRNSQQELKQFCLRSVPAPLSDTKMSVADFKKIYMETFDKSESSAKRDLNDLVDRGIIQKTGKTPHVHISLTPRMVDELCQIDQDNDAHQSTSDIYPQEMIF